MRQRTIDQITFPHSHQGFLGKGHLAKPIIDGNDFQRTDPFLLLMDDQLNLPGGPPVGGPHPHAGFETVTLVLKGNEEEWKTGGFELMTAGKGIIHTEEITAQTNMRILQLWLVLPPQKRWATPFLQQMLPERVPVKKTAHSEIKVYSGSSNGINSPVQNQTPLTIVDFSVQPESSVTQQIPASYNAFFYVIEGSVQVGEQVVKDGQVAWLHPIEAADNTEISFKTQHQHARWIFYAGEPQHQQVVSHGPFVGDTNDDIIRLYRAFRQGEMPHVNDLPTSQRAEYI